MLQAHDVFRPSTYLQRVSLSLHRIEIPIYCKPNGIIHGAAASDDAFGDSSKWVSYSPPARTLLRDGMLGGSWLEGMQAAPPTSLRLTEHHLHPQ